MQIGDITGIVGGKNSSLTQIAYANDPLDEVVVTWIGNSTQNNGTGEMDFGTDEGGHPIILKLNTPTVLSRAQAIQAKSQGAVLIGLGI